MENFLTQSLRWLVLYAPLLAGSVWAEDSATVAAARPPFRLTTSWADLPSGELSVALLPMRDKVKVNPLQWAIDYPTLVPPGKSLAVTLTPYGQPKGILVGTLPIPEKGHDFALIVGGSDSSNTLAWLVPSGLDELPAGGTFTINRSPGKVRFTLENQSLELKQGATGLHPFIAKERIVARLKVEALDDGQWTMVKSNRLILSPGQRLILLIGPGGINPEPYSLSTVLDPNSGSYQQTLPFKAEPKLPDQPAK